MIVSISFLLWCWLLNQSSKNTLFWCDVVAIKIIVPFFYCDHAITAKKAIWFIVLIFFSSMLIVKSIIKGHIMLMWHRRHQDYCLPFWSWSCDHCQKPISLLVESIQTRQTCLWIASADILALNHHEKTQQQSSASWLLFSSIAGLDCSSSRTSFQSILLINWYDHVSLLALNFALVYRREHCGACAHCTLTHNHHRK